MSSRDKLSILIGVLLLILPFFTAVLFLIGNYIDLYSSLGPVVSLLIAQLIYLVAVGMILGLTCSSRNYLIVPMAAVIAVLVAYALHPSLNDHELFGWIIQLLSLASFPMVGYVFTQLMSS